MSHENELQQMAVEDLAQRCAQETDLYFAHQNYDSRYCFELFRRAIRNNDERAWGLAIEQYRPLVTRWVNRWIDNHPDFLSFNEEPEDFVEQALARFWVSYTPAKFDKAQNSLGAVLSYLQTCVHTALVDAWRKLSRTRIEQESSEEEQKELPDPDPTPEDRLQKEELWQLVRKKAKDGKEYIVIYASFYLALSPREILAEYPDQFRDINEIYRYKTNFLERLERDDELREFVEGR